MGGWNPSRLWVPRGTMIIEINFLCCVSRGTTESNQRTILGDKEVGSTWNKPVGSCLTWNSQLRAPTRFSLIVPCGTSRETQSATGIHLQIRAAQQSSVPNQKNSRSYTSPRISTVPRETSCFPVLALLFSLGLGEHFGPGHRDCQPKRRGWKNDHGRELGGLPRQLRPAHPPH